MFHGDAAHPTADKGLRAKHMSENTVLLVDDEEQFVEVLAQRLAARGFSVETADSGHAAVEKVGAQTFDAVLLDMAMPGMDGLETLKTLLRIDPHLQVILLTGRATLGQGVEAMKLGALDLIEKPADIAVLVARLQDASAKRWSLQDRHLQQKLSDIMHKKGW